MSAPVAVNSVLTLDSKLKQWSGLAPAVVRDADAMLRVFDAWLANQPPVTPTLPMAKLALPSSATDPLRIRARKYMVDLIDAYELRTYPLYAKYAKAGTFGSIDEESLVGFLAHKSTPVRPTDGAPRLCEIRTSLLPNCIATLIDAILTTNGVYDLGVTNRNTLHGTMAAALGQPGDMFQAKDQYQPKKSVARVPTYQQLLGNVQPQKQDKIGAIRSAHCDNNGVLGNARPTYKLNPAAGATRQNLYYLWIELLTAFDKNQLESLSQNGLWAALGESRAAVDRICYVEYTAGQAHEGMPVPKARLVYDYNNNVVYFTVHYDSPNHLQYLTWMGVKPYFRVNHDSQLGTETVTP